MSRRNRRKKLPSEPVTLRIESLSHEGRGLAHVDGKVCFVEGALPGETVEARYVNSRRQFDELRTDTVLSAAPERSVPPCEYAGICGGCSLQHLAPSAQLAFKESVLFEQLLHSAGLEAGSFEPLPRMSGPSEHYRRKARLAVRIVQRKGGALVGFREKASSFITDMNDCKVLVSEVAVLLPRLRTLIDSLEGRFEIPQIEVAVGEREARAEADGGPLEVALVFRHLRPLTEGDTAALTAFAREAALQLYLQPAGLDSVHRLHPPEGEERLHYYLPAWDLTLAFHPMDFTQVNAVINRRIIDRALNLLELKPEDSLLDLFCGLGNFTLPAARRCAEVVGVEGSEEMVRRGDENAQRNGMDNVRFHAADLTRPLEEQDWLPARIDKIILDPPRSGAQEIVAPLAALGASHIVYVSCNPATLARDTALFMQQGYDLKLAGVMDMFPHTAHVESMALFRRRKPG